MSTTNVYHTHKRNSHDTHTHTHTHTHTREREGRNDDIIPLVRCMKLLNWIKALHFSPTRYKDTHTHTHTHTQLELEYSSYIMLHIHNCVTNGERSLW